MLNKQAWISPISERDSKKLEEISGYDGGDRVVSSIEWLAEHDQEEPYLFNLKSRIPRLDELTAGFQDGELYTISGYTKNGKTLLAQSLTLSFIKQQYFPLWFTYEVTTKQFLGQFGKECPTFFIPRQHVAMNFRWFIERVREAYIKYTTRVIFIDNLHHLFNIGISRNPSLDIGFIIRTLKNMATNNNLLIFLLCHTHKTGEEKKDPTYHDLRDSSFIGQESDCVLMISRIPETNKAKLWVEFSRRTGVMRQMVPLIKNSEGFLGENESYREEETESGWAKKKDERKERVRKDLE